MSEITQFHDVIRERHSVRRFLPTPVPDELIRAVLDDARHSPSNCNTQPWQVHIVSGTKRDELSRALLDADSAGHTTPDFSFSLRDFHGVYGQRSKEQGAAYYQALGVARDATEERRTAARYNLEFFGSPQVALLFMPSIGDDVRVAGDIGMYGQTFLLSLTAHGLGGIPQTMLGFYADTVREVLTIPSDMKMLFGISFGYPDLQANANHYRMEKASIDDTVIFHR